MVNHHEKVLGLYTLKRFMRCHRQITSSRLQQNQAYMVNGYNGYRRTSKLLVTPVMMGQCLCRRNFLSAQVFRLLNSDACGGRDPFQLPTARCVTSLLRIKYQHHVRDRPTRQSLISTKLIIIIINNINIPQFLIHTNFLLSKLLRGLTGLPH